MNAYIFEQFNVADIYRLTKCIVAVGEAGLSIDKYTQAAVNQSSGNVWVWNEDWTGCVYCSIGFDVAWLYTCPECGEEYDFATYEELKSFASDNDDCRCENCRDEVTA